MRQLPVPARIYLVSCYLFALVSLYWCFFTYRSALTLEQWLLGAFLAASGAACQVFVVTRKTGERQRNDHLTLAPLFAAILLLPRPILALVVIITFLPEWYVYGRKWFGQLFNISVYLIAATLSRLTFFWISGEYRFDNPEKLLSLSAFGVLAIVPVFEFTQIILLAFVFKLAAGQSFRQSGLFEIRSLLLEVGLICVGIGFSTSYIINPLYSIVASLPLVLIFDALHVPNLKEEAATDPKTSLANMRHFNAVMARDLERAERVGEPLSLLVCDLDYLRNINNTYGHQAGDTVLVGIANIIKQQMRSSDVAARFGGEEFVVMLPSTNIDEAHGIAERLRETLEDTRFDVGHAGGPISATISIGVASYPRDGRTHESLMHEADLAVYQAKRDGRNRVVVAGRESRELAGEWTREHLVSATAVEPALRKPARPPLWSFVNQATRATFNNEAKDPVAKQPLLRIKQSRTDASAQNAQSAASLSLLLRLFIALVVIGGVAGLAPALDSGPVPWLSLVLLAGLTMLAEQLAVTSTGKNKISVSVVTILSAAYLYGELGILAATLSAATSMAVKARSPMHRACFNFGMILLSAESALWCFRLFADVPLVPGDLAVLLIPSMVAGLAYYVVNQLLICTARGLHEGRRPWQIWLAEYHWLWPHYMVLGSLGLIVALGQLVFGWLGVVALMAPVGMMHLAIKQYMDRSAVHMRELQDMNKRLGDSYEATLQALTRALDTRDEETEAHSQRVKEYTLLIARQLKVPADQLEDMARGALLHDIGKIGVPDAILLKPGRLTPQEREVMRRHPEIGFRMIAHIPFLQGAAQVVLHHHESFDGAGYPSGLAGTNIPLGARIFAVADAYDAMTSDRPYRNALPQEMALAELTRCKGQQFDPQVIEALLSISPKELNSVVCRVADAGTAQPQRKLTRVMLTQATA